jgi:hypothetical protein
MVMPLYGEKLQYTHIQTYKLIIVILTQFLVTCVLAHHPNNYNMLSILQKKSIEENIPGSEYVNVPADISS